MTSLLCKSNVLSGLEILNFIGKIHRASASIPGSATKFPFKQLAGFRGRRITLLHAGQQPDGLEVADECFARVGDLCQRPVTVFGFTP